MLERLQRKGNPRALLVAMRTGAATMANSTEVPQKKKKELPYDPAIHSWAYISGRNYNSKRHMHPYVHSSTIHNCQDMETT